MSRSDFARLERWRWLSHVGVWIVGGSALLLLAGCDSHADSACEGVADCERGGDAEWLAACQDEAKTLSKEAGALGCQSDFDAYYTCADENFRCDGASASFPGCDSKRSALDACLAGAQGHTACADLSEKTQACSSAAGGASNEPAPACTAKRDCAARCYLDQVSNACAPNAAELALASDCSASCPP